MSDSDSGTDGENARSTLAIRGGDRPRHPDEDPDAISDEPEGSKADLVDITERQEGYGRTVVTKTSEANTARQKDKKYSHYALVLRRKVDRKGEARSTQLEIRSKVIRAAFQDILASCSSLNLVVSPIVIRDPFEPLFQYRNEIRDYAASPERDEAQKSHFKELIQFIEDNLGKVEAEFNQYSPSGLVTFELLWTLFRPETLVVFQTDYFQECYRVSTCEHRIRNGENNFEIVAWYWDYNGISFGPSRKLLRIPEFQGARKITQLIVFPFDALPDTEKAAVSQNLISRGKKWRHLVDQCHRQYSGPTWSSKIFDGRARSEEVDAMVPIPTEGRVYLDYKSHQAENFDLGTTLYGPSGAIGRVGRGRSSFTVSSAASSSGEAKGRMATPKFLNDMKCHKNDEDYEITDEQAMMSPSRVRGFSLSEKQWAFFLVENAKHIEWGESLFDELELKGPLKRTIKSLVETHYDGVQAPDSGHALARKGKGLVILLYGPTGTGKTLTAESVAEAVKLPLVYIGAAELGRDLLITERKLSKILTLAKTWKAIVLIDEADVFLAQRDLHDVHRNGLVSIFLRVLEYHEGVVFLTTNRIQDFDPAIMSRVHLRVKYPPLDAATRLRIWRATLGRGDTNNEVGQVFCPAADLETLAERYTLNGRDIANLARTVKTVAKNQGIPVSVDLVESLHNMNALEGSEHGGFYI